MSGLDNALAALRQANARPFTFIWIYGDWSILRWRAIT